ncbi:MAG: hypothetical protein CTY36_02720 [Methylocystis sp.]|nr:MAG: hypothetical protein CTY36_02720 [Methylocystis sp.]
MNSQLEILPRESKSTAPQSQLSLRGNVVEKVFDRFGDLAPVVVRRAAAAHAINRMFPIRGWSEQHRATALKRIERIPSLDVLKHDAQRLHAAIFSAATEAETRLVVGVMLDGLPAASSQISVGYIDAIVVSILHADDDRSSGDYPEFKGFSSHVLVGVARKLWDEQKFAPAISEFLAIAREKRAEFWRALQLTERLIEIRENAEDIEAITNPDLSNLPEDPDELPF